MHYFFTPLIDTSNILLHGFDSAFYILVTPVVWCGIKTFVCSFLFANLVEFGVHFVLREFAVVVLVLQVVDTLTILFRRCICFFPSWCFFFHLVVGNRGDDDMILEEFFGRFLLRFLFRTLPRRFDAHLVSNGHCVINHTIYLRPFFTGQLLVSLDERHVIKRSVSSMGGIHQDLFQFVLCLFRREFLRL